MKMFEIIGSAIGGGIGIIGIVYSIYRYCQRSHTNCKSNCKNDNVEANCSCKNVKEKIKGISPKVQNDSEANPV